MAIPLRLIGFRARNIFSVFFRWTSVMALMRTRVSTNALEVAAQSLVAAAASITKVVAALREEGMEESWMPWTNQHWAAVDRLEASGPLLEAEAKTQIAAHKAGRVSHAELQRERSVRDYAKRKEKLADPNQPPKKRGRPRKNP